MTRLPARPELCTPDGITAVLMPFTPEGKADLDAWAVLVERSWDAGLTPAVNMDTGHVNLLPEEVRREVLRRTAEVARGRRFVAGVFVEGAPGDPLALQCAHASRVAEAGGAPIIFPCSAMKALRGETLAAWFTEIGRAAPGFLGFELGEAFVPFGAIWDLDSFRRVLDIPGMIGAKHSSLDRGEEWARLSLRNSRRPDFRIYTGNDLAIDMVEWGSDYLLGLSAFHPEAFAARDALLRAGDAGWRTLNDWLQYLGMFAFRAPVPAYKHSCAQFLKLRGRLRSDSPAPGAPTRPAADLEPLSLILHRLDALADAAQAVLRRGSAPVTRPS